MNKLPTASNTEVRCNNKRAEFLLEMYKQTSTHLGRHVSGVWQCAGVVGAALIVFARGGEDKVINDYACALVVLLCGWFSATTLDASNWFNRNLAIITNVERLFLALDDLKHVHPFFENHRAPGNSANHFKIQLYFSAAVWVLVLCYHFIERVIPGIDFSFSNFQFSRALPYLLSTIAFSMLIWFKRHLKRSEAKFSSTSPGIHLEQGAEVSDQRD